MKKEINAPVLIAISVVIVIGLVAFGMKYLNSVGSLDHGQISYTPGVPPWEEKDPAKRAQFSSMPGELRTYSQAQSEGHVPRSSLPSGK